MALLLIQHGAHCNVKVQNKNLIQLAAAKVKGPDLCSVVQELLSNGCEIANSALEEIKKTLPAELHPKWDQAITDASTARAKAFTKAVGEAAPVPTDDTNAAPMDEISAFLPFDQPLLAAKKD